MSTIEVGSLAHIIEHELMAIATLATWPAKAIAVPAVCIEPWVPLRALSYKLWEPDIKEGGPGSNYNVKCIVCQIIILNV